jgi:hypothetical protein
MSVIVYITYSYFNINNIILLNPDLQKYKQEQRLKEIEIERLKNIRTKQILNSEIKQIRKITLIEGETDWQNIVPKQGFFQFQNNDLYISVPFTYYLMYDTNLIEVLYIDNNVAKVKIYPDKTNFEIVVALDTEKIEQSDDSRWYKTKFNNDDMVVILDAAREDVQMNIKNDEKVYIQARESLIGYVKDTTEKYGLSVELMGE